MVPTHGGPTLLGVVSAVTLRRVTTTPPACGGHMLTGADGAGNPLGLVAGPPRTPLGVAVTMGTGWCPLVPAHTWQGWGVVSRAGTTCPSEHPPGTYMGVHRTLGSRQLSTSGLRGYLDDMWGQRWDRWHDLF